MRAPPASDIGRCVRIVSTIWSPTRSSGLSEVSGSWKIAPISRPRSARMRAAGRSSMRCPASRISPPVMRPGGSSRPITAAPVSDLPAPDSPTTPRISPARCQRNAVDRLERAVARRRTRLRGRAPRARRRRSWRASRRPDRRRRRSPRPADGRRCVADIAPTSRSNCACARAASAAGSMPGMTPSSITKRPSMITVEKCRPRPASIMVWIGSITWPRSGADRSNTVMSALAPGARRPRSSRSSACGAAERRGVVIVLAAHRRGRAVDHARQDHPDLHVQDHVGRRRVGAERRS